MDLIDKLVLETENEIKEYVAQRERLEESIASTKDKIQTLATKEKQARGILKTLRTKQPKRPNSIRSEVREDISPLVPTPSPATEAASNGSPDYSGAIAVLADQESFRQSEFMELSGQTNSQRANGAIRDAIERGEVERLQKGLPGVTDSAIYKVVKSNV